MRPVTGVDSTVSEVPCVKKIGFLSFGHWTPSHHSEGRTAADALLQSIELAVAAEELGLDGAYFRVHHFARQLGSPERKLAHFARQRPSVPGGSRVHRTPNTRSISATSSGS